MGKTIEKTIIEKEPNKDTFSAVIFYTDNTWVENWGFRSEDEALRWVEAIKKEG